MAKESHCFHTEFYETIKRAEYRGGRERWARVQHHTKNLDIFRLHNLYIPMHTKRTASGHWAQVVVDLRKREVAYYDSATEDGLDKANLILDYIEDQWRRKHVGKFQRTAWTCVGSDPSRVPQQGDTLDCGVYALIIALRLHKGISLTQTPIDATRERARIAHALFTGAEEAGSDNRL